MSLSGVFDFFQSVFPNWRFSGQNYPVQVPLSNGGNTWLGTVTINCSSSISSAANVFYFDSLNIRCSSACHPTGIVVYVDNLSIKCTSSVNVMSLTKHLATTILVNISSTQNSASLNTHTANSSLICNSNISSVSSAGHYTTCNLTTSNSYTAIGSINHCGNINIKCNTITVSTCSLQIGSIAVLSQLITLTSSGTVLDHSIKAICAIKSEFSATGKVKKRAVFLPFKIGDKVYIINNGPKKYRIVQYLGDNTHYILEGNIIVSIDQITRNLSYTDTYNDIIRRINIIQNT